MATIKSYSDLQQSRKLAEILPLESADMYYALSEDESINMISFGKPQGFFDKTQVAWSLAALLSVLPQGEYEDTDLCFGGYEGDKYIPEWFCSYEQQEPFIFEVSHADNPVDACYEMIIRLNELKNSFINTLEVKEVDIDKMLSFKCSIGFAYPEGASEYQKHLSCYRQGIEDVLKAQKGEEV